MKLAKDVDNDGYDWRRLKILEMMDLLAGARILEASLRQNLMQQNPLEKSYCFCLQEMSNSETLFIPIGC